MCGRLRRRRGGRRSNDLWEGRERAHGGCPAWTCLPSCQDEQTDRVLVVCLGEGKRCGLTRKLDAIPPIDVRVKWPSLRPGASGSTEGGRVERHVCQRSGDSWLGREGSEGPRRREQDPRVRAPGTVRVLEQPHQECDGLRCPEARSAVYPSQHVGARRGRVDNISALEQSAGCLDAEMLAKRSRRGPARCLFLLRGGGTGDGVHADRDADQRGEQSVTEATPRADRRIPSGWSGLGGLKGGMAGGLGSCGHPFLRGLGEATPGTLGQASWLSTIPSSSLSTSGQPSASSKPSMSSAIVGH